MRIVSTFIKGVALAATLAAGACASKSGDIQATYVSPVQYQGYSCNQIRAEAARLSSRAAQVAGVQDQKAQNDAVATGVGVVLFWPALFFIKGDRANANELARLKGEMDAIEQVSVRKNCGVTFRRA